nr:hypothetical protein [uncultured Acidocella sp.]
MALRKAWAHITIELGLFGWGRPPKPTLPHQRSFGLFRISWGPGSIDQGVLTELRRPDAP